MLVVLKVFHVVLAAAWFGHKLLIPRDLRHSLREETELGGLVVRMRTAQRLGIGAGLGTVLTGVALVLSTTGFKEAPTRIYVALGAVILMFVVGALLAGPAWSRIEGSIAAGSHEKLGAAATTFNRALAVESLLWVVALTAMLV